MRHRAALFRLRAPAQDVLLALLVTGMQVQGTLIRNAGEVTSRRLTELGSPGHLLLFAD